LCKVYKHEIMDTLNDHTLPISVAMGEAIKRSEYAPEIIRYLGNHRDQALQIYRLDDRTAVEAVSRIELLVKDMGGE